MDLNIVKKRIAFTLAEILITLGIIGIVAAMTIPTLMANYQKEEYTIAGKKAYSEFNQALIKMASDNGCTGDLRCTGLVNWGGTQEAFGNEIVKYFKVIKNCESSSGGPTINGCFSQKVAYNYDGTGGRTNWYDNTSYYRFITADGMSFSFSIDSNNCGNDYSNHITNNMTQLCGRVWIDVNGPTKGPNNWGRDIYYFWITNGKGPLLYPIGGVDDNDYGNWKDASGNPTSCYPENTDGSFCTGRVVEENWKMNY